MKHRGFLSILLLAVLAGAFSSCSEKPNQTSPKQLNILFIMSDDHAFQAISAYDDRLIQTPNIDRLAQGGMRFDSCFCTNSICAPSRAVILTGKHSHLNGVRDNAVSFDGSQQTFPKLLQGAGYQTAMIGKWHLKSEPTGFDYWNVLPGQGHYYNPDLIEMGEKKQVTGYVTDIVTDIALDFLEYKRDESRPFLLMLHHKAPHRAWHPAARHLTIFDETEFPEPATLFDDYTTRSAAAREQEMTLRDHMRLEYDLKMGPPPQRLNEEQKAAWEAAYSSKIAAFKSDNPEGDDLVRWKYQRYMQDYLGCIAAVDENIGRVLDYLEKSGLAENTLVIYTSDQGFYLGEHGWFDKRFMYEESLRMPMLARLPGVIPAGSVNGDLVSNLDFAPTFLDLAGMPAPQDMQGESLLPLLQGKIHPNWRESVYYHYYEYPAVHMTKRHNGVRTQRYKLMHFYHDIDAWELYDLKKDPQELLNVYADPNYAEIGEDLKSEMTRLQELYRDPDSLAQELLQQDLEKRKKRQ